MDPTFEEPEHEARAAVAELRQQIRTAAHSARSAEHAVLNTVMDDGLNIGREVLKEVYPEVDEETIEAAEDQPYEFAAATELYSLVVRLTGALDTAVGLVQNAHAKMEKR